MKADLPSSPEPSGKLSGAVDNFLPPRLLSGWARNSEQVGRGLDITVSVYRGDRMIAEGPLTRVRPDIVNDPDYLTEFRLVCTEDVPDEVIAFDLLRIEARDNDGRTCKLEIWDRVRGFAFGRLMQSSTPLGKAAASAVLSGLGQSRSLAEDARQAILQVHDLHFEEDNRRLLYQFENLGKDCSVGGLQRAYGAEPLGLLRFAGIGVDAVINAMKDRFRGVGSAEFTRLEPSDTREYYSTDTRYGMSSHTFIYEGDVEFDRFFQQQCKKIEFLAQNIMEKLQEGDRIFVIHAIPEAIPDTKLRDLLRAMRSIGSAPLLYLQAASDTRPLGSLAMRDDGIMEGYVLQIQGVESTAEIRESWLTVCRKAQAMVPRANAAAGMPVG